MEIVFTVYDLDLIATIEASSDVVDNIFTYPDISTVASPDPDPVDSFSNMTFSGNFAHVQLAFRLTCDDGDLCKTSTSSGELYKIMALTRTSPSHE